MRIFVNPNDSPKIYALLRDIYGQPIGASVDDIQVFSYTVNKIVSGSRVPVEGFVDVPLDPTICYHETLQAYPDNIQGLSTAEKAAKYNVEVFPYKDVSGSWVSPFTDPNSLYELVVNITYSMDDDALVGAALIDKSFIVSISVGAA